MEETKSKFDKVTEEMFERLKGQNYLFAKAVLEELNLRVEHNSTVS